MTFKWSENCEKALLQLKTLLTTAPLLISNFNKEFILKTDASISGLGAVLAQQTDVRHELHLQAEHYESMKRATVLRNWKHLL